MNRTRISTLVIAALVVVLAACGGPTPAPKIPVTVDFAGSGSGNVTASVDGKAVKTDSKKFAVQVDSGKKVVLSAKADAGSTFAGFSGAGCSGTSCTVTANSAATVTATFNEDSQPVPTHVVTVTLAGSGSGSVSVNGAPYTGPVTVNEGSDVTLVATADADNDFAGWGGACDGQTGETCVLAGIAADAEVTATFEPTPPGATKIEYQVMARADGGEEFLDPVNTTAQNNGYTQGETTLGTNLYELTYADRWGSTQAIGLRFLDVDVPTGATITNAYLEFTPYFDSRRNAGWGDGNLTVNISAQNSLTADGFVDQGGSSTDTRTGLISGRTRLGDAVAWPINEANWPTTGDSSTERAAVKSADITTLIEGLNALGNGLDGSNQVVFILEADFSDAGNVRHAYTFNGDPSKAPKLVIEYTMPE